MTFLEQLVFDINFLPSKTYKKSLRRSFRRLKRPPLRRNEPPTPVVTQPVVDGTRQKPPEFLEDEIKVKQGTCQFKVSKRLKLIVFWANVLIWIRVINFRWNIWEYWKLKTAAALLIVRKPSNVISNEKKETKHELYCAFRRKPFDS